MPYLLTFSTYGSYLPGDSRGSTDRHIGYREAEPRLEDHVRSYVCRCGCRPGARLQACKAYATRSLKGMCEVPNHKYWTRSGDIRRSHAGRVLASAIHYVLDGQGTRMEVYAGDGRAQDPPIS